MNMDQRWRVEFFALYKEGSWVTIGNHTIIDNDLRLSGVARCNQELLITNTIIRLI